MTENITHWLSGRLPDDWYDGSPDVTVDRDEIVVVGRLPLPEAATAAAGSSEAANAVDGRIARFREDTRDRRITIAREAEARFGRTVAWGVTCGDTRRMFTTLSVPVMTRLRQPERVVLDTLVEAGVARSRSDALGWCVRLVGRHTEDWLTDLRAAMEAVREVRNAGPEPAAG